MAENEVKTETRSTVVKIIIIAFIVVNIFVIGVGILTPFGAERVKDLLELIFWFDISSTAIIAAYFGADVWARLNNLRGPE